MGRSSTGLVIHRFYFPLRAPDVLVLQGHWVIFLALLSLAKPLSLPSWFSFILGACLSTRIKSLLTHLKQIKSAFALPPTSPKGCSWSFSSPSLSVLIMHIFISESFSCSRHLYRQTEKGRQMYATKCIRELPT